MNFSTWLERIRAQRKATPEPEEQELEGDRELPPVETSRQFRAPIVIGVGTLMVIGMAVLWFLMPTGPKERKPSSLIPSRFDQPASPLQFVQPPEAAPTAVKPPAPPPTSSAPPVPRTDLQLIPAIDPRAYQQQPMVPAMGGTPQTPADPLADRKASPTVIFGGQSSSAAPAPSAPSLPPGLMPAAAGKQDRSDFAQRLEATETPSVSARRFHNRSCIMAKGTFMDCVLQTAIDTELPGMTRCVISRNVYGDDGTTVLLDRGTELTGEVSGKLDLGQRRIFALWTRAKTPQGVTIDLGSPGTDALGRAGLSGQVDNRFWERFGPAILLGLISDVSINLNVGGSGGGSQTNNQFVFPTTQSTGRGAAQTVLEHYIKIPPRIVVNHGQTINITAARDLNFCSVYRLEPTE